MYGTTAAQMVYAQSWREETRPTKEEWQTELIEYIEMARLTNGKRDQDKKLFEEVWKCFMEYLETYCRHIKKLTVTALIQQ